MSLKPLKMLFIVFLVLLPSSSLAIATWDEIILEAELRDSRATDLPDELKIMGHATLVLRHRDLILPGFQPYALNVSQLQVTPCDDMEVWLTKDPENIGRQKTLGEWTMLGTLAQRKGLFVFPLDEDMLPGESHHVLLFCRSENKSYATGRLKKPPQ